MSLILKIPSTEQSLPPQPFFDNALLIVDDDAELVTTLKLMFERHYQVRTALSGSEALLLLQEGFAPQVILADQRMPSMTGAVFLAESIKYVPKAVRVILTGYSDLNDLMESINSGNVYRFLTKPFVSADLMEAIRLCFEHYALSTNYFETVELNKRLSEANQLLEKQKIHIEVTNAELESSKVETERAYRDIMRLNAQLQAENQTLQFNEMQAQILRSEAELRLLRYQINPHFLFNSLSSIRGLVRKDPQRAWVMISKLSEYLRYAINDTTHDFVPLSHELAALSEYFDIELCRFEEQLQVEYRIEPEATTFLLPSFIVQPLAENALKYGLKTSTLPLKIRCEATVMDDTFCLTISNTGKLLPHENSSVQHKYSVFKERLGLNNVSARLSLAFGERASLNLSEDNGIVKATILVKPS